ncbi:MAG: DNA polymerase IV [Candidatus Methanoperedens sp.]|nr:DNA polymerase IV [Candidatus Methanoperedens sp.]
MTDNNRIILHVDMDSFFASVEMREKPELIGKPVVVGADPKGGKGRGVVSTCSYEARKYGIKSGMPISRAYKLCPTAVFLPVNYLLYAKVSSEVMRILRSYAEKFQQVSIDEAYMDVSNTGSFGAARQLALKIKNEIMEKEKLTCSIGVGPSKIVAKIASDYKKPDDLTVIEPSHVKEFLSPLPVRKIPGIGVKTEAELKLIGIEKIGQLADYDVQKLLSRFGKWSIYLHNLANGIDESEVREEECCKSISRETTFEEDTDNQDILNQTMEALAEDVQKALLDEGFFFKTLTIKVRYRGFITRTRAHTLLHYTDELGIIKETAKAHLLEFIDGKMIRLIGVRLSRLEKTRTRQKSMEEFVSS